MPPSRSRALRRCRPNCEGCSRKMQRWRRRLSLRAGSCCSCRCEQGALGKGLAGHASGWAKVWRAHPSPFMHSCRPCPTDQDGGASRAPGRAVHPGAAAGAGVEGEAGAAEHGGKAGARLPGYSRRASPRPLPGLDDAVHDALPCRACLCAGRRGAGRQGGGAAGGEGGAAAARGGRGAGAAASGASGPARHISLLAHWSGVCDAINRLVSHPASASTPTQDDLNTATLQLSAAAAEAATREQAAAAAHTQHESVAAAARLVAERADELRQQLEAAQAAVAAEQARNEDLVALLFPLTAKVRALEAAAAVAGDDRLAAPPIEAAPSRAVDDAVLHG